MRVQIDEKLLKNVELVQQMIEQNPFPPPEDAALDAPAPTDADHDVRATSFSVSKRSEPDWPSLPCPTP